MTEVRPTLRSSIRALPRAAWIMYAGAVVNRFGSFVLPFLILYLRDSGFSVAQAGGVVSAYGVGSIGAIAFGGLLADRLGRRQSIAISMFGSAATMLMLSQAHNLVLIIPLVALAGLFAEMYRPATSALLTDIVPPERRIAAFAVYRFGINLGVAMGLAVGGFVAERSFFLLFLGDAATSVIFGVVALTLLPTGVKSSRHEEQRGEATRTILRDGAFMWFLLSSLLGAFVYMQHASTLPLYVDDAGLSTSVFGGLLALNAAVVVLLEIPLVSITQRLPLIPVLVFAQLLIGFGFAMTGMFEVPILLGVSVVVWTLGEIAGAPVASAYVAGLAPEHLRGRYQGAWSLMWSAALILGPLLGTLVYAAKPSALWALCALLGVAAGVAVAGTARHPRREAEALRVAAERPSPAEPAAAEA